MNTLSGHEVDYLNGSKVTYNFYLYHISYGIILNYLNNYNYPSLEQ